VKKIQQQNKIVYCKGERGRERDRDRQREGVRKEKVDEAPDQIPDMAVLRCKTIISDQSKNGEGQETEKVCSPGSMMFNAGIGSISSGPSLTFSSSDSTKESGTIAMSLRRTR
jgi:hypothetical protein